MRPALVLALAVLALRMLYLALLCPYTLAEDEAQYWVWSLHPDWSYATKGPGIAWTIWLARHVLGDAAWAIRTPATLSSFVTTLALAGLTWDIFRSRVAAFATAVWWTVAPIALASAVLMTIDPLFLTCWLLALWAAWRGLSAQSPWWLVAAGAALGAGCLYKYTTLLLLPGLAAWVFAWRRSMHWTRAHALATLAGLSVLALSLLPMVLWNARHGWTTLPHLLGHLGVEGGDVAPLQPGDRWPANILWLLQLIGTQFMVLGVALFVAVEAAWRAWKGRHSGSARWRGESFLLLCAAPILLFYMVVSLLAKPEGNWPLAGVVTLLPLAGWRVAQARRGSSRSERGSRRIGFGFAGGIVLGVVLALGMMRIDLLARLPGWSFIPVGRLTGADVMGLDARRVLDELRTQTGREPFVLATHYGRAAQLWYYIPGRPTVYCASPGATEKRPSAWDFWPDTRLANRPDLLGRDALVVGAVERHWSDSFERIELVGNLRGDHKKGRPAYKAFGYRGPRAAPQGTESAR